MLSSFQSTSEKARFMGFLFKDVFGFISLEVTFFSHASIIFAAWKKKRRAQKSPFLFLVTAVAPLAFRKPMARDWPRSGEGLNECGVSFGLIHRRSYGSGQIIATSHDLTPNGGLVREIPLF